MDAATAGDHWSRCRLRLRFQLPLPLSLNLLSSLRSEWICNHRAGFCIRDGGRQVFKTSERSGSDNNAGCGAGYNATCWGSSGCWCATTACTQRGGWSICWPSLCRGRGRIHALIDICNARIVQGRWGGGVLILDCRGYGTLSLRGIPLANLYRNASPGRRKLRIPRRPTLLLILTISKTSNISYDWSRVRVRALGMHSSIYMFHVRKVGTIACACIWNGRRGRLLFERSWMVSTKKGGAVWTTLDSKHWQYLVTRSLEKHSIMGLTAIRLNSD